MLALLKGKQNIHSPGELLLSQFLVCNCFALALAGTCIGFGALPTEWKPLAVAQAPVTGNVHQSLDAHLHLGTKLTLHLVVTLYELGDGTHVVVGPIGDLYVLVNT